MRHHILILENDTILRTSLMSLFRSCGWESKAALSLHRAYELIQTQDFELVLVDRLLPDGDGLSFIEYLRDWYPGIKILCLSSKAQVNDRIIGFSQGADDYLAKPFASQELVWRVRSLLTKQKVADAACYEHKGLHFFPETGLVTTGSEKLYLGRRENQILLFLLRHKGSVVTRRMLLDALWPGEQELPMTTTLDVYIRRVRQKLSIKPELIVTVRGYGYMIMA